jgi:hypothetical protein
MSKVCEHAELQPKKSLDRHDDRKGFDFVMTDKIVCGWVMCEDFEF